MANTMINKNLFFIIVIGTIFCMTTCQRKRSESREAAKNSSIELNINTSDTVSLSKLIKRLLQWAETDTNLDFKVMMDVSEGDVYTGIDWKAHDKRIKQLSETNLFTGFFLKNYQDIAVHLDKELKQNSEKYYVGELPPYGSNSNVWCNCQDYPEDWEKLILIIDLKINTDSANFKWTWDKEYYNFVRVQKENSSWRISYLEQFNVNNFVW
jgi:hypothetical protein